MKKFIAYSFLFFVYSSLHAQQFGGHPPSTKWKQINSDTARIIFPTGMDSVAQRVASVVHYLARQKPFSLGNDIHKINIVLQNQTTVSNGYVGLGPFRSEYYLTPILNNFEMGSIAWSDQLAVHEYRHVQQFNNFRNGISNLLYHLFGEEGLTLGINASVPDWFFEGDAVYNETVLTNQGRGRLPLFLNGYNSLWRAGKNYSWMKLRNGSLKDYVPDHYQLGYLLVNYGREKYGPDFWTKVTRDASAFKGLFYPFQKAVKKYAGVDYKTFREQAFAYYKGLKPPLPATANQGYEAGVKSITPSNSKYVTNELFPYELGEDSLLYLRNSYRHVPAFYIKDKTGLHRLRAKDIALDDQYGYRNGKIVYAAYEPDARWGWKDYSVIKLLDIRTGKERTITHKTKYLTPDISGDGTRIAVVEADPAGKNQLLVLNAEDGKVLHTIKSAEIGVFTDPKFIDSNNLVSAVRLLDGRMALAMADIERGSTERLTPLSYNVIGYPSVQNGIIYFTASYSGNDDVFALRLKDRKIFRITSGSTGNYFVNAGTEKLTWSAFTADGYVLKQLDIKDIVWKEVTPSVVQEFRSPYPINKVGEVNDVLVKKIPGRNFEEGHYSKTTGLFNFHSWRPYYEDPIFTFSLYGENILNTLQTEVYYLYNQNENTHAAGVNAVYGGLFPYISVGTEFTFDRAVPVGNTGRREFNQLDTRIGLNIPLDLTKGRMYNFFNVGTNFVLRNEFNTGIYKNLATDNFSYLNHFINWSQQTQKARQQIYPRLGYSLALNDRYAITSITGYQFLGNGSIYLPGFLSTHSLVVTGGFQQRDTGRVLFSNQLAFSRGYSEAYFARMWRLSANYHLPLIHPDWGFGNILYLQRFRANAFYDLTRVYSKDKTVTRDLRSAGCEIYVDTKWWNQYPLTFGIRYSHLLDNDLVTPRLNHNQWEFILPVSIFPK